MILEFHDVHECVVVQRQGFDDVRFDGTDGLNLTLCTGKQKIKRPWKKIKENTHSLQTVGYSDEWVECEY